MILAEFGGEWRSLAYPKSLFWVRPGCIFTLLFITPGEQVLWHVDKYKNAAVL